MKTTALTNRLVVSSSMLVLASCAGLLKIGSSTSSAPSAVEAGSEVASTGRDVESVAAPAATSERDSGSGDTLYSATNSCTIAGALQAWCMEARGFPQPSAPRTERAAGNAISIQDCYRAAKNAFSRAGSSSDAVWYQLRDVADVVAEFPMYPKLAADPGMKACLAFIDEHTENSFTLAAKLHAEQERLRQTFSEEFKATCGIDADLYPGELGDGFRVVVGTRPKKANKKVAFSSTDPGYKIYCTGASDITRADGTIWSTPAQYRDENAIAADAACVRTCASQMANEWACGTGGSKLEAPACQSLCKQECD